MKPIKVLETIVEKYKDILGKNLVGIYLHGSLAMGCYTEASDIDFVVLVKEPMDRITKRAIIEFLIELKSLPEKGIEMSIVLEQYAREFIYPTPFELHYSKEHKDRYMQDHNYICGGYTDRDLAAHFTIIKHRGKILYGKDIEDVFGTVPRKYYIDSIMSDIANAREDIIENTVYTTLNLCRVLYYLKENIISSKPEAGEWAKGQVPQQYKKIVEDAIKIYQNELVAIEFNNKALIKYADYMVEETEVLYQNQQLHS